MMAFEWNISDAGRKSMPSDEKKYFLTSNDYLNKSLLISTSTSKEQEEVRSYYLAQQQQQHKHHSSTSSPYFDVNGNRCKNVFTDIKIKGKCESKSDISSTTTPTGQGNLTISNNKNNSNQSLSNEYNKQQNIIDYNSTAFPFPPPLHYFGAHLNNQNSINWSTYNTLLNRLEAQINNNLNGNRSREVELKSRDGGVGGGEITSLTSTATAGCLKALKGGNKVKEEDLIVSDQIDYPTIKRSQSKSQMNGFDRNSQVNLSQGNRLFQENSLDWLADVAVQSRTHHYDSPLDTNTNKKNLSSNSPSSTTPTLGASSKNYSDSTSVNNSGGEVISSSTNIAYNIQRNDTHYRASEMPQVSHLNYSGHTVTPFQYHGTHLLAPIPNYFTNLYQYCPSTGNPSSPFLVPTPPASAPPTGRPSFFSPESYHQNLLSASSNVSSNTSSVSPMNLPQNLSLRSPPINHSPISPSSLNSPLSSGPSTTSPTRSASTTQQAKQQSAITSGKFIDTINKDDVQSASETRKHEGSLKHRILRLPTIQLNLNPDTKIEPAPMSAPPVPVQMSQKMFNRKGFHAPYHHLNHTIGANSNTNTNNKTSNTDKILKKSNNKNDNLFYPECFNKGSYISLADGITVKRVEEMSTEDFLNCSKLSPDLKIDSSCILELKEKVKDYSVLISFAVGEHGQKFTVEAPLEHPFYVYHRGWASASPERTLKRYGLICQKLKVNDMCISLCKNVNDLERKQTPTKEKDKTFNERKLSTKQATINLNLSNNNKSEKRKQLSESPTPIDLKIKNPLNSSSPLSTKSTDNDNYYSNENNNNNNNDENMKNNNTDQDNADDKNNKKRRHSAPEATEDKINNSISTSESNKTEPSS